MIKSYTCDESDVAKLNRLIKHRQDHYPLESTSYRSASAVVRDAIDMYHRYIVDGESIIHPDDPRFNS